MWSKDASHQLYNSKGVWRLAQDEVGIYYVSKPGAPSPGGGPPAAGPQNWEVGTMGEAPVPTSITHKNITAQCSCVHAVSCAACHNTGTGDDTYIPPTAVELVSCADEDVSHIKWQQLFVGGGSSNAGMLMTDGLCLDATSPSADASSATTAVNAAASTTMSATTRQRVQLKTLPAADDSTEGSGMVSEVRITVTATNGIDAAHINEIRLYGKDGLAPFPSKPK